MQLATSSRTIAPIHTAALLEGPGGVSLHLRAADGGLTQVPLSLSALREIAALAGAALASAHFGAAQQPPGY
ncbi:hypothetical protein [Muricoccus radiodurans]|uniref:hypothetical protein n=1 Tax=Muricoccus radiodurans TaxID=2231721 RepID=UPI003CFAACD2